LELKKLPQQKLMTQQCNSIKVSYEVVEVTVEAEENTGTAPVTAGSIILGCYPKSNQDQFVDSIAVSETTLTITLAGSSNSRQRIQRSIAKGVIN
jgi:hypothetical protein